MRNRRTLIASIGVVGTVAIAGCSGVGDGDGNLPGGGPEDTAEQYFTAIENGDVEAVNEVLYTESSVYPTEEDDLEGPDLTFVSAEELSAAEAAETRGSPSEEEVERLLQEIQEDTGADDAAIVSITLEENGGTNEESIIRSFVKTDGDWKFYG